MDIRAIRKATGLSQIKLARLANVSRFRLSLAEERSIELRADELDALGKVLGPEVERARAAVASFTNAGE